MKRIYFMLAILSAILFGAASPLTKPLLEKFSPFQLAGLLYLGAAIGVGGLIFREKKLFLPWKIKGNSRYYLTGAIIFGGILGPIFLLAGLKIASAASVSMWLTMETASTAVLGHFLFKDYLSKRGWIAVFGTIFAAIVLAWGEGPAGWLAGLFIVLATISWGVDNHLTALIDGISPAQSTFWKGIVAGAVNLGIGLFSSSFNMDLPSIGLGLLIGVFSYGISIVLYIISAQNLGATRSQMLFSSAPFFGVFLSAVFLGETLTIFHYLGAGILAGVIFILFSEDHIHDHFHPALIHHHDHDHRDDHHNHNHEQGHFTQHAHLHTHEPVVHSHRHLPDLHHRHDH